LIPEDKRQMSVTMINDAVEEGARCFKACQILHMSMRTVKRWQQDGGLKDKRHLSATSPANKLSNIDVNQILNVYSEDHSVTPVIKWIQLFITDISLIATVCRILAIDILFFLQACSRL